ncbi:MAG: Tad domain-containing protein [Anaerolineae bacterium]|nr:Tad domain-containing protein [Anaerolineae bacterium]
MNNKTERGQAIVMIAIAIVGLIGFTALAIDGGNAFSDRRNAQNAADTAALSAALAKVRNNDWNAIGQTLASSNGYNNDSISNTVNLYNPPIDGTYAGNNEYIQVIIVSHVDTFFASIVGVEQLTNTVEAVARAKPAITEPMVYGNAMVSLAPTECQAYYVHGTAATEVTGGGVFVNSNGDECNNPNDGVFEQQGSASLLAVDGGITSVGDAVVQNPSLLDPYPPTEGATAMPYPPEFAMPEPDCGTTNSTQSGSTLTPGNVAASWLRNDVFLEPGTYCISGDLVLNASNTLEGHDVTLYFVDGGLHINGAGEFLLDAPDSGEFAGLLIFLPMDNDEIVILNGNATSEFEGSILAPASEIQINGTGNTDGYSSQVIGYTIDLIGTADTYIHYEDSTNYDATVPPRIELAH